jgi:hypothetical protein
MITQASLLHSFSQHAPLLSAALSAALPAHSGLAAHAPRVTSSRPAAAAGASSCISTRSISSGKQNDADEKLGRPTTPWVRQVISGVDLMRHPKYNKGTEGRRSGAQP